MNTVALTKIAPEIFRKRLLVEGYYRAEITEDFIRGYFQQLTSGLGLRTYGPPIVHKTNGQGKEVNQGFDAFVPLIDSGIYLGTWGNRNFVSTVIYTCGPFDEQRATQIVKDYFQLGEYEAAVF
jgi:hypothetical protein